MSQGASLSRWLSLASLLATLAVNPSLNGQQRPAPATPGGGSAIPIVSDHADSGSSANLSPLTEGLTSLAAGATHIVGQQCLDDGWGWPHMDCSVTYHNITGPIAIGLLMSHTRTGNAAHLTSAMLAGDFDLLSAYPIANEVQTITIPDLAIGSITLSFNGDGPTASLMINSATATDIELALEGLSTIDDVTVVGGLTPTSTSVVTFVGATNMNTDVPLIIVDNTPNAGPDVTVAETTTGGSKPRFGTFTPQFMRMLSDATGDPTYADFAALNFFDALHTGTYSPSNLNTTDWIGAVQTARTGTWVNLRPWEFHLLIRPARADVLGNVGQTTLFRDALLDGLNTLDNTDPGTVYSDIIGLAGGVRGLALDNYVFFPSISSPNHALIDGTASLCDLADILASLQNPDGSWYWHSDLASPTVGDEDSQTTAFAILALQEAQRRGCGPYGSELIKGRDWLWSMQDIDGGFASYPGDIGHNTEVEGEVLTALTLRLGDVDGNDIVNVADFLSVLVTWGLCVDCPADFDGDGKVGILDFLILLANWG